MGAGALPGVGKVVSAESHKGIDRFRLSLGKVFNWSVTVNPDKGTVGGSIQVGDKKAHLVFGIVVALVAALMIPTVSGLLLPAALVAVTAASFRKLVGTKPAKSESEPATRYLADR